MKTRLTAYFAAVALCASLSLNAQERLPEYLQAEKFTQAKLSQMLFDTQVRPNWFKTGNKFWYSYKTSEGTAYYLVDPVARTQRPLWDNAKIAAQLTEIVKDPYDAQHLPIRNLRSGDDDHTLTFEVTSTQDAKPKADDKKDGKDDKDKKGKDKGKKAEKEVFYFSYNTQSGQLTHLADKEKEPKKVTWASVSPDKKTVVYAKDFNLYRMSYEDYQKARKDEKDSTIVEIQLTTDGVESFGYGMPRGYLNTDTLMNGKRRAAHVLWSPDSKYIATVLSDDRKLGELWVINAMAKPRPTLETYKYAMPGEKNQSQEHLYIFDMTTNTRKEINVGGWKDQTLDLQSAPFKHRDRLNDDASRCWEGDNSRFFISRTSRDLHRIDLCSYTIGQDTLVPIVKERMNTYLDERPVRTTGKGKNLVWWSERDGWAHLYHYNDKGQLLNRITEGPWHVHQIVDIDEATGTVFFTACGRNRDENPYYMHLYRANINGGGVKQLTKGEYFHEVTMDDDARYFVDNYSRVNTIPTADLIDANGTLVTKLATSDFSQLRAAGYKFPELCKVKAADGVTDLYGTIYKPYNFDPNKKYPIVDYVYPGPQVEGVYYPFTRMSVRTDRLAQAGFIVISVGQRGGHPNRSKWYHNYGYGNMRDYPLADHKYAIEQLAQRDSCIDITRVGIHGHSGGGFMSTAAICTYPDFFKAAVSCAGNHDNNIYNRWWSEKHHGVQEKVSEKGDTTYYYHIATNPEIAKNLKGHLLLVHGDIDNNVHPANTTRVINALIRAGKRFDMLFLPEQRHGFGDMNEYFYWRLVDYFSEHLKGQSEHFVDIPKR